MKNDTIAAIITSISGGAVNIIRISGEDSRRVVDSIFKGASLLKAKSHTVTYGHIVDDEIIDEVLVSVYDQNRSYTYEEVVEISCHGGAYVTNKVLELVLKQGVRLALPGEFTYRAFMNGRIDLTKAESVMDVISASSHSSLTLANKGLNGNIYNFIVSLRKKLLSVIANIEVNIDYPEYDDVEQLQTEVLGPVIEDVVNEIKVTLDNKDYGQTLKHGIQTVIVGRPNVGKSSLLNALINEDKAIVTSQAGTTRDIVEGKINIAGVTLNLIDTAGIRESDDLVESIGINKAKELLKEATLCLLVLDNSTELTLEDKELLELTKDQKRIILVNKIDLSTKRNHNFNDAIYLSAVNKDGFKELEDKIKSMFLSGYIEHSDITYISNARHIALLEQALSNLQSSLEGIALLAPIDLVEIDIKDAWYTLGEIIGDSNSDSLLDELFSNFCLGK